MPHVDLHIEQYSLYQRAVQADQGLASPLAPEKYTHTHFARQAARQKTKTWPLPHGDRVPLHQILDQPPTPGHVLALTSAATYSTLCHSKTQDFAHLITWSCSLCCGCTHKTVHLTQTSNGSTFQHWTSCNQTLQSPSISCSGQWVSETLLRQVRTRVTPASRCCIQLQC